MQRSESRVRARFFFFFISHRKQSAKLFNSFHKKISRNGQFKLDTLHLKMNSSVNVYCRDYHHFFSPVTAYTRFMTYNMKTTRP